MASSTTTQQSKECGEMQDILNKAQKEKKADLEVLERMTKAGYGKPFESNVLVPYLDNEMDMAHYAKGWRRGRGLVGTLEDGNKVAYAALASDTYFHPAELTYDKYLRGCIDKSKGMANSLNWDGKTSDLVLDDRNDDKKANQHKSIANGRLNIFMRCKKTPERIEEEKRQLDIATARLNVQIPVTLQCQQCEAHLNITAGGNVNLANANLQQAIDCVSKVQSGGAGSSSTTSSGSSGSSSDAASHSNSGSGGTNVLLIIGIVAVVIMMLACLMLLGIVGAAMAM
jgi:hypothetical protein